jgi:hypothetical protein
VVLTPINKEFPAMYKFLFKLGVAGAAVAGGVWVARRFQLLEKAVVLTDELLTKVMRWSVEDETEDTDDEHTYKESLLDDGDKPRQFEGALFGEKPAS